MGRAEQDGDNVNSMAPGAVWFINNAGKNGNDETGMSRSFLVIDMDALGSWARHVGAKDV
eukprot:5018050-Amphidinium_carterae.1